MAGKPQDQQMVRNKRIANVSDGEPVYDEQMSLYDNGGSLVVGLTSFGKKLHRLQKGEDVTVEIYDSGIWIDCGGDRHE